MDGYSINPGLQTAVTVKLPDSFEDLDEHILQNVRRLSLVLENVRDEVEDRALVNCQQVSESLFGACLQLRDQGRLFIDCGKPPLKRYPRGSHGVHYAHTIPLPGSNCKIALAFLAICTDTAERRFVPETLAVPAKEKPESRNLLLPVMC